MVSRRWSGSDRVAPLYHIYRSRRDFILRRARIALHPRFRASPRDFNGYLASSIINRIYKIHAVAAMRTMNRDQTLAEALTGRVLVITGSGISADSGIPTF